jgi:hypothetical protein
MDVNERGFAVDDHVQLTYLELLRVVIRLLYMMAYYLLQPQHQYIYQHKYIATDQQTALIDERMRG